MGGQRLQSDEPIIRPPQSLASLLPVGAPSEALAGGLVWQPAASVTAAIKGARPTRCRALASCRAAGRSAPPTRPRRPLATEEGGGGRLCLGRAACTCGSGDRISPPTPLPPPPCAPCLPRLLARRAPRPRPARCSRGDRDCCLVAQRSTRPPLLRCPRAPPSPVAVRHPPAFGCVGRRGRRPRAPVTRPRPPVSPSTGALVAVVVPPLHRRVRSVTCACGG